MKLHNYYSFIILLTCVLAQNTFAASTFNNIDEQPDMFDRLVIIVANVPARTDSTAGDIRKVLVEREMSGPTVQPGITVPVRFNDFAPALVAGHYILLLQNNGKMLIYGSNIIKLGPIINSLPVKDLSDPKIDDIQIIIDTAKIANPGEKWQKLEELCTKMKNRTLIMQYVIDAQVSVINYTKLRLLVLLIRILNQPADYSTDVIISADKTIISLNYEDYVKHWVISTNRQKLFTDLSANVAKDSPDYTYITTVLDDMKKIQSSLKPM